MPLMTRNPPQYSMSEGSEAGPSQNVMKIAIIKKEHCERIVHMHVSLSAESCIGKKQVGGWKQAPVLTWRSNPGKHSAVEFVAKESAEVASAPED